MHDLERMLAFEKNVCEQPKDASRRLVYADWLEEQGLGKIAEAQRAAAAGRKARQLAKKDLAAWFGFRSWSRCDLHTYRVRHGENLTRLEGGKVAVWSKDRRFVTCVEFFGSLDAAIKEFDLDFHDILEAFGDTIYQEEWDSGAPGMSGTAKAYEYEGKYWFWAEDVSGPYERVEELVEGNIRFTVNEETKSLDFLGCAPELIARCCTFDARSKI